MRPVKFPQDELPHNNIFEWWYFHGHLKDQDKKEYSFMLCFFKVNIIKTNVIKLVPFKFLRNLISLVDGHIAHFNLSDLQKKKFFSGFVHLPKNIPLLDFEEKQKLGLHYLFSSLHKQEQDYCLEFKKNHHQLSLVLKNNKKPLLNGPKNQGYLNMKKNFSYYYTLSNMSARGTLKINRQRKRVSGKAWMDHQWGNFSVLGSCWTWFGIQLDNNTEYMVFHVLDRKKNKFGKLINVSYSDSSQKTISQFSLKPLKHWTSPKTGLKYVVEWELKFMDKKPVKLKIKSCIKNQEMCDLRTVPYYEGNCRVTGTRGKEKIKGRAYLELVDYDQKWLKKFVHVDFLNKIKKKL